MFSGEEIAITDDDDFYGVAVANPLSATKVSDNETIGGSLDSDTNGQAKSKHVENLSVVEHILLAHNGKFETFDFKSNSVVKMKLPIQLN